MLFSLPCCEDHGSPSHGDKCPHVWNLTKKAEVPNKMTSWHTKLSFYCSRIHCMELQSGFAQKPYWRARVSTGHPNRSWTLHSPSHASPACKASPQFQFRRTVTNVFQVTRISQIELTNVQKSWFRILPLDIPPFSNPTSNNPTASGAAAKDNTGMAACAATRMESFTTWKSFQS